MDGDVDEEEDGVATTDHAETKRKAGGSTAQPDAKRAKKMEVDLDPKDPRKLFEASLKTEVTSAGAAVDEEASLQELVPTLEKPFQCGECRKCFMSYVNLSTHVDHYHGFKRECNFQGCRYVADSSADFCEHYIRHMDPDFVMPSQFEARKRTLFTCPMCPVQIKGMWKFFGHAHTHDREPRFKVGLNLNHISI